MATNLFTPGAIGPLALPNRMVRSATHEGLTHRDGEVTARYAAVMAALAEGGVALIVTGHLYVRGDGRAGAGQAGLDDDRFIPGLRQVTDEVHRHGAKIVAQISHAGALAEVPVAPSAVADPSYRQVPEALGAGNLPALRSAFVEAALRAKAAGFDGVQLHAAHGYLLSQFLTPSRNLRGDTYGGSPAGRARFPAEVCAAIRRAAGPAFAVLVKMNGADLVDGGLDPADAVEIAAVLATAGADAIEVSGGLIGRKPGMIIRSKIDTEADEGYFRSHARGARQRVAVPVISVGGWRSPEEINRALAAGDTDFVALSRPLVREPGLVRRWREGDLRRSACISCSRCLRSIHTEAGLHCPVEVDRQALGRSAR